MNILIVSNNYPSPYLPHKGAFVYNLTQELAKNHNVVVINPIRIQDLLKEKKEYGVEVCKVYRPLYFSFSNKKIFGLDFAKLSFSSMKNAVIRVLKTISKNRLPDIVYTHFYINALTVDKYAIENNIPLVVASGESSYDAVLGIGQVRFNELINRISKVIAVSEKNKDFSINAGLKHEDVVLVPNAVDTQVFFPMDKDKCKESLGYRKEDFVVGFIGHFIHRKGLRRVIKAIDSIKNENIKLLCVGEGDDFEDRAYIKHLTPMANNQLPSVIGAFDVFVLPTLSEGHCNVIEEVKACGVPIISSKGTTVEKQMDDSIGILVDPENINEISSAINSLFENESLRKKMATYLVQLRKENPLELRANIISDIFNQLSKGYD